MIEKMDIVNMYWAY